MTIVEVIPSLSKRAGAEVFLLNLVNELKKTENVVVVSLYCWIDPTIQKMLNDAGVKVYFCNKKVGVDVKCGRLFKKIISEIKPDVLHMHLNCASTYFLAFGFRKQKFSVYLTVHSLVEKDFKSVEIRLIRKYIKKNIIIPIGISELITENIKTKLGVFNATTINNGTKLFAPVYDEPNPETISIVCVAAFRPEKNQTLLISSFVRAQAKCDKKLRLCFVGDGPLLDTAKKMVDNLSDDDIVFAGRQDDVYPFLKESHIFCLSSKYEGNPISIIEAMSVGLPIIAPDVGGIPDVVKDGVNGRLFRVDDDNDLARKLLEIINDRQKRKLIRENNITDSKEYDIKACSENYLKLFKENRRDEK